MSVLGVQGQPERVLKECGIVGGLVRELQRATVVRESGEVRDKRHNTARELEELWWKGVVSYRNTLDTRAESPGDPSRRSFPPLS
jgi:hypothetical protein